MPSLVIGGQETRDRSHSEIFWKISIRDWKSVRKAIKKVWLEGEWRSSLSKRGSQLAKITHNSVRVTGSCYLFHFGLSLIFYDIHDGLVAAAASSLLTTITSLRPGWVFLLSLSRELSLGLLRSLLRIIMMNTRGKKERERENHSLYLRTSRRLYSLWVSFLFPSLSPYAKQTNTRVASC